MNSTIKRAAVGCLVLVILTITAACKKGAGQDCVLNKDCADKMICIGVPTPPKCMTIEAATAACAAAPECKANGWCGLLPVDPTTFGRCWPTSEAHCKASAGCKTGGACKFTVEYGCKP